VWGLVSVLLWGSKSRQRLSNIVHHPSLTGDHSSAVEEGILVEAGHHSHSEGAARRNHHRRRDIAGRDSKTCCAKRYA
jgi:hypothetical protein